MPHVCTRCGADNPDEARFCSMCGNALTGGDRPRERKYVACLFADLVGSTVLGESADPEVVQNLVTRTFTRMAAEVRRHGGTVDKVMGDAILALFGVPAAHEDDPERAVRAGLEMQRVLADMNREATESGRPELAMRIGIEAGEVMVMTAPSSDLPDRMVTGDPANTASRLQTAAEPGTVVVGPAIHAATRATIEYEALPPQMLKGKAEPVPAWVALRPVVRPGERVVSGETPFVGRDEELETLVRARRRTSSGGRPALVSIIGLPGVGKSRLAEEFRDELARSSEPPVWMHGRCLPYGGAAYSALREAVAGRCGVHLDASSGEWAEAATSAAHGVGAPELAPAVAALLGVSPDAPIGRDDLFESWRRYLELVSAGGGLVLALEDIHWGDDGLLDFIEHVTDWAEGRIMLLTLSRPDLLERRPGWGGGKRSFVSVALEPLPPEDGLVLLDALLGTAAPSELAAFVLDRSEGNPLFTEEIVRALVDRDALARHDGGWRVVGSLEDADLPRSIQGVIASRIDGLLPDEKARLADAAVVGRKFWAGALARLAGSEVATALRTLDQLRLKELVQRRPAAAFGEDTEFTFRHALIRDVAYRGLPKGARARKHVAVAEWLESAAGAGGLTHAELIGAHYVEARRLQLEMGAHDADGAAIDRAVIDWSLRAGVRAEQVKDVSEAISWFEKALEAARATDVPRAELATLTERLGDTYFPAGRLRDAEREYRTALTLYSEIGDDAGAGRMEAKLAFAIWYTGSTQDTWALVSSAVRRLEPLGEGRDLAHALTIYGMAQIYLRQEDGVPALRRGVAMARAAGDLLTLGQGSTFLGTALVHAGDPAQGIRFLEEGERIARQSGDAESKLVSLGLLADALDTHSEAPDPERVDRLVEEALDVGRKGGRELRLERTLDTASWMAFQRGRLDESEHLLAEQLEIARRHSLPAVAPVMLLQAWIAVVQDRVDDARRLLAEAETATSFVSIRLPIVAGLLDVATGDYDGALEKLVAGAARDLEGSYEAGVELRYLLLETVLAAHAAGTPSAGEGAASRLAAIAEHQASARPFRQWVAALSIGDATQRANALGDVADVLAVRREPMMEGRCRHSQALTMAAAGIDATAVLAAARGALERCGAALYVRALPGTTNG